MQLLERAADVTAEHHVTPRIVNASPVVSWRRWIDTGI